MQLVQLIQSNPLVLLSIVCMLGLIIGSFLNVVIHRLPIMLEKTWRSQCEEFLQPKQLAKTPDDKESIDSAPYNLVVPRSSCPSCQHMITALENIPVISYLILKGKCSACGTHISIRYPIVEVITAFLSIIVALHFGPTWQTVAALFFTWALIALTFIDFDHQLLPDNITLPFVWLGMLIAQFGLFTDLNASVIGAIAGYMALWLVYWLFKLITGKEGMGFGDFKLLALLGAWLGWQLLPVIILLSSMVGAIVGISLIVFRGRNRNVPIPFGPYLAAAGWIAMLWGQDLSNAYLEFSGINSTLN